jgi:hypothetical protein
MRIFLFFRLLVAGALLGLVQGCQNEDEQIRQMLTGRWELSRAFRNDKSTETLKGPYFVFSATGKMETNLPVGADVPAPYKIRKDRIIEQQSPRKIKYLIKEISDTALVLGLELRGIRFDMFLKSAKNPGRAPESPAPNDSLQSEPDSLAQMQ